MSLDVAFSRAVGAMLVLLGIAVLGSAGLGLAIANRAGLIEERNAKDAFVQRSIAVDRRRGAPGDVVTAAQDMALIADSGTRAAATLDALVRAAIAQAGGLVLSSQGQVKAGEAVGGRNERIELQAVVQGRIEALQAGLYRLESGRPMIIVDQIGLRLAEDGVPGDPQAPMLTATVTLSAYWARPHAETGASQ